MQGASELAILAIGLLGGVVGIGLSLSALAKYRADKAPRFIPSWKPKDWIPIWKTRTWFTEKKGYRMYLCGMLIWILLPISLLIVFLAP